MISIKLIYNRGFKWFNNTNIYSKGFLFDKKNNLYINEKIIEYFEGINNKKDFENKINDANGLYSIVIKQDNILFIAVDRIRMFPLFYSQNNNKIIISDDVETIKNEYCFNEINLNNASEFIATGYVTGKNTLINNIYQVQAGEIICFDNFNIDNKFYYKYITNKVRSESYDELKNELITIFENTFKRFISSLNNRTVVIPLSGGYDSRLIAVMLKKMGYDNVICYTYGRKNNIEIPISKKVAEKLGYKWIYIEYNEKLIDNYLIDNEFIKYYKYSANYTSMFFMQEYFAVKYLKENSFIPDDSIFVPGHSGDFLGGSQITKYNLKETTSINKLVNKIYLQKYFFINPDKKSKKIFIERIKNSIINEISNEQLSFAYSIFENWDFKEKLAKFIFNSASVYNYFGYEFRLPYWDNELVDFFKFTHFKYKKNKLLYDDVLKNNFFNVYGLNFEKELQITPLQVKIQNIKNKIKPYLPYIITNWFLKKNDIIFYLEITNKMIDDLKEKGKKVYLSRNSYNSIIVQWYIHNIKDEDKYKDNI